METPNFDNEPPKRKIRSWRPTIRSYLIFMNMILLCLLFPSISYIFLNEVAVFRDAQLDRSIRQMQANLKNRSASLARSMALSAGQAIDRYDFTFLNSMVDEVSANDPEIIECILMNVDGRAVVHSDPDKLGNVLSGPSDHRVNGLIQKKRFPAQKPKDRLVGFVEFVYSDTGGEREDEIMEAVTPVYIADRLWGVLRCAYSLAPLHREIRAVRQDWAMKMGQLENYLITMTFIFFSVGALVAALFTRTFVRSMHVLSYGVRRVSEGRLDHEIRLGGLVCEEFMRLSDGFNIMTNKLRILYMQLDEYNRSLEQKVAERTRELKEAQSNLIQQAHEAGMAEMAVGILHNIGNAITPAKVGAALLIKDLENSPIRNHIQEAMTDIREAVKNNTDLNMKKKERLLSIIEIIPESIREEYGKLIAEIQLIRNKHEHIESIINLQMRYAKVCGDPEEVDVNRLIDDAFKMLEDTIRKRPVNVVKRFSDIPNVRIEQAKLIQIIVNLIKNGVESLEKSENGDKDLVLSTYLEEGPQNRDWVLMSIRDSGIGFSSEEKELLFTFGYTTKSKGSGFGLHSCANYLIANHGMIHAHSDGKGKGAEFIVRLPAINRKIEHP